MEKGIKRLEKKCKRLRQNKLQETMNGQNNMNLGGRHKIEMMCSGRFLPPENVPNFEPAISNIH